MGSSRSLWWGWNLSGFSEIYDFHAMVCKSPTQQPQRERERENRLMNAKEKDHDSIHVVCFHPWFTSKDITCLIWLLYMIIKLNGNKFVESLVEREMNQCHKNVDTCNSRELSWLKIILSSAFNSFCNNFWKQQTNELLFIYVRFNNNKSTTQKNLESKDYSKCFWGLTRHLFANGHICRKVFNTYHPW